MLWIVPASWAQRAVHIGYVYPAGAQRGTTTVVVVGGQNLDAITQAYVSGDGVRVAVKEHVRQLTQQQQNKLRQTLQELRQRRNAARNPQAARNASRPAWTMDDEKLMTEVIAKLATANRRPTSMAIAEMVVVQVTVAADAPLGKHELRLGADDGYSNPLAFFVGQLPEFSEASARAITKLTGSVEPNDMNIIVPATVNGQILPGGVNRYRFQARKGQNLIAAASARELIPYLADGVPGWFQAALSLYDSNGHELAYDDDFRFDPDPVIHYRIPQDGQYIIEIKDALYRGREDFVYRLSLGELPYVASIFPLGGPVGVSTTAELNGWNLPKCDLTISHDLPGTYGLDLPHNVRWLSNHIAFAVDRLPECRKQKPKEDSSAAQLVRLPIIINGRIDKPGESDVFSFQGYQGQNIVAEVYARRLNSPLDSQLQLVDASGHELAFNDDLVDPAAGLVTHQADSYLRATLPADGTYFIYLSDAQSKGGSDYAYRLRIGEPRPDFELRVMPSSVTVRAGGGAPVTVYAIRRDGFSGAITLDLAQSAGGIKLGSAVIPAGQDQAKVTLMAPADAGQDEPYHLHLQGHTSIDGHDRIHSAVPAEDMMQAFAYHHLVPVEEMLVTVTNASRPRPLTPGRMTFAATITSQYWVRKLELTGDKAADFLDAYVEQATASLQQLRINGRGTPRERAASLNKASNAMRAVLETNLTPPQVEQASQIIGTMFGGLEREVIALQDSGVPRDKIAQALPVLSTYVSTANRAAYDRVQTGLATAPEAAAKSRELRLATARDLTPIIGADAAAKWARRPLTAPGTGGL